jgi:hypothetical protein
VNKRPLQHVTFNLNVSGMVLPVLTTTVLVIQHLIHVLPLIIVDGLVPPVMIAFFNSLPKHVLHKLDANGPIILVVIQFVLL